MKALVATFAAVMFTLFAALPDAEAARVGGGRSVGMQRSVTPAPRTVPAQQQGAQLAAQHPGNRVLDPEHRMVALRDERAEIVTVDHHHAHPGARHHGGAADAVLEIGRAHV